MSERQVQLAERDGEQLAGLVRGLLEAFDLTDDPRAPRVVRDLMMRMSVSEITA